MQEYFLRLEATDQGTPLSPEIVQKELRLPEGWRVVEEGPALGQLSRAGAGESRAVGEVFTYALLLWPAVVGLIELRAEGWQLALKIGLAVWLGLLHIVAFRQGRGAFFGNSLLMLSACIAAFWWTHPGPWMYLWLVVVVIGLYAAVRGVLNGRTLLSNPAPTPGAPQQGNG